MDFTTTWTLWVNFVKRSERRGLEKFWETWRSHDRARQYVEIPKDPGGSESRNIGFVAGLGGHLAT